MASLYADFRKCAGCRDVINIAAQPFLYRCEKYWHELCFRCKSCESRIPNCKYVAIVDDVWHESCYEREHYGSSSRTRNQIVCQLCKGMGKKMEKLWQSCEKLTGQCRRRGDVGSEPCQDQASGTSIGVGSEPCQDQASGTSIGNDTSNLVSIDVPAQPTNNKAQNGSTTPLAVTLTSPVVNIVNSNSVIATSAANSSSNSTTYDHETLLSRELCPTYKAIIEKYGDITNDSILNARGFKSAYLTIMCKIVKTLQTTRVDQISEDKLQEMFFSLRDIEKAQINVGWLEEHVVRLRDRMYKLAKLKDTSCTLEKAQIQQEIMKETIRESIKLKEEELARLKGEYEEAMAKYDKIHHECMVVKEGLDALRNSADGLL